MMMSHNHGDSPLRPYPSGPITVTQTLAPGAALYDLQATFANAGAAHAVVSWCP